MSDQHRQAKISGNWVWLLLGLAGLLLVWTVLSLVLSGWIDPDLSFRVSFGLMGLCLTLGAGLMVAVNRYRGEDHIVVAPYAGKQVVGRGFALAANLVLLSMGLFCLATGVFGRDQITAAWSMLFG